MDSVMELLLHMTIVGSVTAILILFVKLFIGHKMAPKYHLWIWIILAIRLVIPVMPQSDMSIFNVLPSDPSIPMVEPLGDIQPLDEAHSEVVNPSVNMPLNDNVQTSQHRSVWSVGIAVLWLFGAIMLATYLLFVYLMFLRKIQLMENCKDIEVLQILKECKEAVGIKEKTYPKLRMSQGSPMLCGIFRPVILINEGYTKEELRHIFIHELCHYKHKDIWITLICGVLLCIYWYNPILWVCFFTIQKDIEILCDHRAVNITKQRKEYAQVLLKTALKGNQFLFPTTSMQNGEKEVVKRMKQIAHFQKPKKHIVLVAITLICLLGIVCLSSGVEKRERYWIGGGSVSVPQSWNMVLEDQRPDVGVKYIQFGQDKTHVFAGMELRVLFHGQKEWDVEKLFKTLPIDNHSEVKEKRQITNLPFQAVYANVERDLETAAQQQKRKEAGDMTPLRTQNENHIYFLDPSDALVIYNLWGVSSKVSEKDLMKIAKTFQKSEEPSSFQPSMQSSNNEEQDAKALIETYFKNYKKMELPKDQVISDYGLESMIPVKDTGWTAIYPGVTVYRTSYWVEEKQQEKPVRKRYENQMAIFSKDSLGKMTFLGFHGVVQEGNADEIAELVYHKQMSEMAKSLLENKTKYIGNASKDGSLIACLPMSKNFQGMELQTSTPPYGITAKYHIGDHEITDDVKVYSYQNAAILLSLIENAGIAQIDMKNERGDTYKLSLTKEELLTTLKEKNLFEDENFEDCMVSEEKYINGFLVPLYELVRGIN